MIEQVHLGSGLSAVDCGFGLWLWGFLLLGSRSARASGARQTTRDGSCLSGGHMQKPNPPAVPLVDFCTGPTFTREYERYKLGYIAFSGRDLDFLQASAIPQPHAAGYCIDQHCLSELVPCD